MHTENETSGNDASIPTAETPTESKAAPTPAKTSTRPAKKVKASKGRKNGKAHRPKANGKSAKPTKAKGTSSPKQALPVLFPRSAVKAMDVAWKKLGLRSRMELFRKSLHDYLRRAGQLAAAVEFREQDEGKPSTTKPSRKARR